MTCGLKKRFYHNENVEKIIQIHGEKIQKIVSVKKLKRWKPLGLKNVFLEVETREKPKGALW